MKLDFKKFLILAGNYGSGKTEISLNIAMGVAMEGKKTMLLDMDIVNPYFRSSEYEKELRELGIRVVKPSFANTAVDVPSLSAEIYTPFDSPVDFAVFDAGGDPVGAAALGILREKFDAHAAETEFLYIINPRRPLQETSDEIVEMLRQIESVSRRKVTGLVNNANIAYETTAEIILEGQKIVEEVSKETGIPQKCVCALEKFIPVLKNLPVPVLPIRLFTRPEWLDFTE